MSLPTLYEYYTEGGINSGLSVNQPYFTLNDKNISLYSGALHYFRVPKQYWRDRLRKFRAAGLNAVETYIPWNLHEPQSGVYEFGNGGSDMEDFLDIREFLKTAQEEDLFAVVRSGPYICAEWEFGGLPSWLLREKDLQFRSSEPTYMKFVKRYFNILLPILAALQFVNGGPVIAFQVENEYAYSGSPTFTPDKEYLKELRQMFLDNGIRELLVTSDGASSSEIGSIPEYFFLTANFAVEPESQFDILKQFQQNKPSMAMEFWTGMFDSWTEPHNTRSNAEFQDVLERILKYPASVNMYMFIGGTNFGFLNGGDSGAPDNSQYRPYATTYDYNAPLSENGNYTQKYYIVKELLKTYNEVETKLPELPELIPTVAFPSINVTEQILLTEILDNSQAFDRTELIPMELLPINNNSGQSYGYIVYRKTLDIPANGVLKLGGHISDTVMVLLNGQLVSNVPCSVDDLSGFGYWTQANTTIVLTESAMENVTLDLVVENYGRGNSGSVDQLKNQHKGLWRDSAYLNDVALSEWKIIPLEFNRSWNTNLGGWHEIRETQSTPALYKARFDIEKPQDTFIDVQKWSKGFVIINGFVLGRYFFLGPQQTLYLPAPLLKTGTNTIIVFEQFNAALTVDFSANQIFHN